MFGPNAKHEVEISITAVQTDQGVKNLVFKEGEDFSLEVFLYSIVHIYLPFARKQAVSLYFGRNVRTRLRVAISEVSGPPVFHIKAGAFSQVSCPRTQQANLPACFPQSPLNAERQAGKLWISFFKVFCYDSTRGMNPKSTEREADALTSTSSRWLKLLAVEKMVECTML